MRTRRFWAFVIPALLICLVPAFSTEAYADDGENQSAAVTIGFTVARKQTASVVIGFTKTTPRYNITVSGGNVTAPSTAKAGDTVTLTYTGEIPAGYVVVYSVNGEAIEGDTFTMPDGAVEVGATLEKVGFVPQDPDSPEFARHSLILSGQIGVDFYVYIPSQYDPDECTVDFDVSGDISENPAGQKYVETEDVDGTTLYVYRCCVNSVQMADTIHATLNYGGGTISHDYTAKTYLDAVVGDETLSDDLRELARRIKDYGCYVQPVLADCNGWTVGVKHASMDCEYSYDDSDFEAVSNDTKIYAISRDSLDGSGIESLSYALVLDSETALEIYLTPSGDYSGSVAAFVDGGAENMAEKKGSEYVVTIGGISAHKLGTTHTVTVKTGEVSFDVRLSALSYVQAAIQQEDPAMKRTVTSLYHYWKATMTYRRNRPDEYPSYTQ